MFHTNSFSDVSSVEQYIAQNTAANALYKSFKPEWKKLVQDFFLSKRTLPLTYDPFFKRIFNTDIHPERLSDLLSAVNELIANCGCSADYAEELVKKYW